jgi:hypothetical protein
MLRAPSGEDLSGENQWAALRAAHQSASKKPSCFVVVPRAGISPRTFLYDNNGAPCRDRTQHKRVKHHAICANFLKLS